MLSNSRSPEPFHIVRLQDSWALEGITQQLSRHPSFSQSDKIRASASVNYFVSYHLFEPCDTVTAAFFTHLDETQPRRSEKWWRVVEQVDLAVFMSRKYQALTKARYPKKKTALISPGVNHGLFKPKRLVIGVAGRSYRDGRKGEDLLQRAIADFPAIDWRVTGTGWDVPHKRVPQRAMPGWYRSLDYLLIPSRLEGGPLPAIEALSSGVPVISAEVGWMGDLPHHSFDCGDYESLKAVLREVCEVRQKLHESVASFTWDNFREAHHAFFSANR